MPYGMKNGDTPEKDAKMESCVRDLMSQGHDKISAIKICKSSIDRNKKPIPKGSK